MNLVVVPTVLDFANRIINLGGIESVKLPRKYARGVLGGQQNNWSRKIPRSQRLFR